MSDHQLSEADRAAIDEARAQGHADAAAEIPEPVDRVEDVDAGGVPARLYAPAGAAGALLYLHGGGFVFGDLVTHDSIARRLANRTGRSVLMPDYRRAPEHPYPAAVDDTAASAAWWAGQGHERLAVVGDSAGAALALGEVLRHPTTYDAQVLVYPFIDPSGDTYDRSLDNEDLSLAACQWFWRLYLQGADVSGDHALNALERTSLAGLPRTLVQLAALDVLTPAGKLLADRLAADEVPTRVELFPAVGHGFWRRTDNDQSEPALGRVAEFLAERP